MAGRRPYPRFGENGTWRLTHILTKRDNLYSRDIASLREMLASGEVTSVQHIRGSTNPADPLTKVKTPQSPSQITMNSCIFDGILPEEVWPERKKYVTAVTMRWS